MGRVLDRAEDALAGLAAACLAGITLVLCANVGLRAASLPPVWGITDGVELALMTATFLGAPWALREGGHVSVDLLAEMLPGWTRRAVAVLGAALCAAAGWAAWGAVATALARGSTLRGVLAVPEWLVLLPILAAFALLAAEFARAAVVGPPPPRAAQERAGL